MSDQSKTKEAVIEAIREANPGVGSLLTSSSSAATVRELAAATGVECPAQFERIPAAQRDIPVSAEFTVYAPKRNNPDEAQHTYLKLMAPALGSKGTFARVHNGTGAVTQEQRAKLAADLRALAEAVEG